MLAGAEAQLHGRQIKIMTSTSFEEFWQAASWVESANDPALGFPLQSLPYCSFVSPSASDADAHLGAGIGSFILDLNDLSRSGLLHALAPDIQAACSAAQLNPLMHCGATAWSTLRQHLFDILKSDANPDHREIVASCLTPMHGATFHKPVAVHNYTDFYASMHHATNVGRLFRPDQPLLPNYSWIPIGYNGRASSLLISDTRIRRPNGQFRSASNDTPTFAPTAQLDYELEVAAYIGTGNALGTPIPIAQTERHIFGLSLLNDWSARDIQAWESQPLGPFLGKSFATSLSPWVISMDALNPFRIPLSTRDHEPLPYLAEASSGLDLELEVLLSTAGMREASLAPVRLSLGNLRDLHWSFAQLIAHHTSNGCNLLEGDLLATGTVSGPQPDSLGCLLEITQRGALPLHLPNNETRTFLEDGDEVIFRGFCAKQGFPRITFGECRGTILPALQSS